MKLTFAFRLFFSISAMLCLPVLPLMAQTTAPPGPTVPSRDYITARLAELRRIHTPEGIESLEEVTIGGARQWVSIRGRNRANPVLLFIHGGPGTPMMPMTWAYQAPWEDFFTIVQWDQRGVGKNAATADREALKDTLTTDRIIADAEELTAWVRKRLDKEKIVVLGYSYGTQVAMALAERRPEWLHAYVGTGQMSGGGSEAYIYQRLLELATKAGNEEALRELKAIAPYPGPNRKIADTLLVRKWARHFNGGWYGKPDFNLLFSLPDWAPEYTQADLDAQERASQWFSRTVMGSARPQSERKPFKVPVIVIMGRHDLHTPYEPAKAFFETLVAPHKRFITLERSAHVPMLEEPGMFLLALIQEVLPLTEGRAAFAPPR
ncbi:MAG: alpha/beta hydrolase [Acidobacteriota bacterium]|nr:MAG: alpha/beta hydrolase [Acidobacteriota bacterium]